MEFEIEIIRFIQQFRTPFLDKLFEFITVVGEDSFITLFLALLFWCINKKFAYKLGIAYMSNGIINVSLKETFKIPRPIGQPGVQSFRTETAGGYSFPSGHSQSTSSAVTSIMTELKKKWCYVVGFIIIFLVALSRLYLGVHTLKDVIVGALIGVSWVLVSNKIFDYIDYSKKNYLMLIYLIPTALGMIFFRTSTFYKAAGVLTSLIIGYIIDSKYINYVTKAPLWKQIIKYAIGISVLLFLQKYIKILLPPVLFSGFIRYFIMGMWVFVLSPLLFAILKLEESQSEDIPM